MSHRIERVNNLLRQELSELLKREVKDPRLSSFISITEVVTSPDLRHARVYVSSLSDRQERQEILSVLAAASGFLRNELSKILRLRHVPELSFYWDDSIERGAHLLELIDKVSEESKPPSDTQS